MRSIPHRTASDIRTRTDRASAVANPGHKFLTLAMLELESVRRGKEKQRADERSRDIGARLREIEQEEARLLASLEAPRGRM